VSGWRLRFTMVGLLSVKDLRRRNSAMVVGSHCSSSVAWKSALIWYGKVLCAILTFGDNSSFSTFKIVEELSPFAFAFDNLSCGHRATITRDWLHRKALRFIATRDFDGPFKLLVHPLRSILSHISSGASSVVNGLQRAVKKGEEKVRQNGEIM
jgi:hypothetical protein